MKRTVYGVLWAGVLSCTLLVGCTHSRLTDRWGHAQRENVARMVVNPNAGQEHAAPRGLDAGTGEQVMENYRRSQAEQQDRTALPSIINLGIGTR